jgi:hypothetical protein
VITQAPHVRRRPMAGADQARRRRIGVRDGD